MTAAAATTPRPHKRAHCPCCSYENRASLVPAHIISAHPEQIRLRPINTGHCVFAYILKGKEEYGFCVCLTCKCGTMGDGYDGNHGRWVTMHARKKECSAAHSGALTTFKTVITTTVAEAISLTPPTCTVPIISPSSLSESMALFWEQCRKNKKLLPFVEAFEKQIMPEEDDPEDPFIFDPVDACERAIINACTFHNDLTKKKKELNTFECATKQETFALQRQITTLEFRIKYLESKYYEQTNKTDEHKSRIEALEAELGLYKSKYPDPINIDQ